LWHNVAIVVVVVAVITGIIEFIIIYWLLFLKDGLWITNLS
jgi:hypothetical protein